MGILSEFEDRVATGIEGLFAGAFRSPVQPAEIAKALARAADDARAVGVNAVYAPNSFTVALSAEDSRKFGTFKTVLAGELATYLVDHAREQHYLLTSRPVVTFVTHTDLKLGRIRVSAALTDAPAEREAGPTDGIEADRPRRVTPVPGYDTVDAPVNSPVDFLAADAGAAVPDAPAPFRTASAPSGAAVLTFAGSGRRVPLDTYELIVGRLPECAICLDDANVSRRHAAFIHLDDGWAVTDLGSTNGTRVNGNEVRRARLHDGDVVEIGLTRLTFHEPGR